MEKVSLVAAMGDDGGIGGGAQDASRSGGTRGLLEGVPGLRPVAVRGESASAEKIAAFEDGSEEVLTRRRSGSLPTPNATSSPRVLKPVSIIFAPPNNLARYCQPRGSPTAADAWSPSITLPWVGEVTWKCLRDRTSEWLRNPRNWALGIWGVAVFVSGAVLFMVMVGMLDNVLPRKADRDLWFEASNQTINALFTLFVLLLHPVRVLHLVWLLQWRRRNIPKLRALYCKDGVPKRNEWTHMLVVLLLYQLNCFAQYAVCALNWCYTRAERPVMAVMVCFVMALGAGCAAGIYTTVSPLGKAAPQGEDDAEDLASNIAGSQSALPASRFLHPPKYDRLLERNTPSLSIGAGPRGGHVLVDNPQWQGGVLECWDAPTLVPATVCCFPCVLGHNLSRLGFGNRYVHIVTFLLACFAPFVIFEFASINVDSREFRRFLRATGIIVSIFGLCYGGFWRIRMRETYHLPEETWCCNHPNLSDFARWLLCSGCALCQEVRTAEAFDITDNRFYVKAAERGGAALSPRDEEGFPRDASSAGASLQPLPPVSTVVRITEMALSNIRDPMLDPPPKQNVFHS